MMNKDVMWKKKLSQNATVNSFLNMFLLRHLSLYWLVKYQLTTLFNLENYTEVQLLIIILSINLKAHWPDKDIFKLKFLDKLILSTDQLLTLLN